MMTYVLELIMTALRVCFVMVGTGIALMVIAFLYGMAFDGDQPSIGFYIAVTGISLFSIVSDALEVSARK